MVVGGGGIFIIVNMWYSYSNFFLPIFQTSGLGNCVQDGGLYQNRGLQQDQDEGRREPIKDESGLAKR